MNPRWAIGLDLGGTNARMALVDRQARILEAVRRPASEVGSPDAFVAWAAKESKALIVRHGLRRSDCVGVGVGVPGPVDPRAGRVLLLPNLPSWNRVPLAQRLGRKTGFSCVVENDGNVMALAEYRFGAARGVQNTLFLTLGTGIGCGIVHEGRLFRGSTFSAGEISHIRYGDLKNAVRCGCGSRGCIETRLGQKFLTRRAEKELKPFSPALRRCIARSGAGAGLRLEHVTAAAQAGDARALRFWSGVAEEFGDFLGGICNLLNPDRIVIGGGVAGAGKFLFDPLRASVRRHAFDLATRRLKIVPAKFGADAGIIGAAALAFARSEEHAS